MNLILRSRCAGEWVSIENVTPGAGYPRVVDFLTKLQRRNLLNRGSFAGGRELNCIEAHRVTDFVRFAAKHGLVVGLGA